MLMAEESKDLCSGCLVNCCEYIVINIGEPEKYSDVDRMIWYIFHKIPVFIDTEDAWVIEIKANCQHLDEKKRCRIYDHRPDVCRNHSPQDCERHGDGEFYNHLFTTKDELLDFIKKSPKYKHLIKDSK